MRITRVRRLKIAKKKRIKILFNFFFVLPIVSITAGYLITDIIILPMCIK